MHVGKRLNTFGDTVKYKGKRLEIASIDLQGSVLVNL